MKKKVASSLPMVVIHPDYRDIVQIPDYAPISTCDISVCVFI